MPRGKKELAEQIIPKLREVEVEFAALIAHRGFDACGSAVDRAILGTSRCLILSSGDSYESK